MLVVSAVWSAPHRVTFTFNQPLTLSGLETQLLFNGHTPAATVQTGPATILASGYPDGVVTDSWSINNPTTFISPAALPPQFGFTT